MFAFQFEWTINNTVAAPSDRILTFEIVDDRRRMSRDNKLSIRKDHLHIDRNSMLPSRMQMKICYHIIV